MLSYTDQTLVSPVKLAADLGKPTMRGIRRCPKCGTYNGTRGLSCKNKACDMVFKEAESRTKKAGCDAVRLYTGDGSSVYSVRLRDKGPDYRGFVQLATVDPLTLGSTEETVPVVVVAQSQCFVETCSGPGDGEVCTHISSCLAPGVVEATPVMLRHSAMNDLDMRPEIKREVYSMAEKAGGPLVQRVSKHVFCVKCEPGDSNLGYLHMCFMEQKTKDGSGPGGGEFRFFCSCPQFRGVEISSSSVLFPQWTAMDREREPDWQLRRCIHFYSCLCAFASDSKLREEFKMYINLDQEICRRAAQQSSLQDNQVIAILGQDENGDTVQVEVVNQNMFNEGKTENMVTISEDIHIEMETPDGRVQTITVPASSLNQTSGGLSGVVGGKEKRTGQTGRSPVKRRISDVHSTASSEEANTGLTFHQWLASVTERINQTMHYQFDGHPEPLVFHAPQMFFDCLRERISGGSKKKRLPNSTISFVRKDALPLGSFTKHTWIITNVLHVKQIFDTPHLPLEITRTFIENKDGSFSINSNESERDSLKSLSLPGKKIRAHELKTYLKVGQTTSDQKDPTPFIIEWIPEILPFMKIGELRIKFEYGHQRNGQLEHRTTVPPQISDGLYHFYRAMLQSRNIEKNEVTKQKQFSKYTIKRCHVMLEHLLVKKQDRLRQLTKCRVDIDNADYKRFIKQAQAKQILSLLEKLEKESNQRESLLNQRKGKLNKTRSTLALGNVIVNKDPQTPQAEFLANFSLKPSVRIVNNKVLKNLSSDLVGKDWDVDSGLSVGDSLSVVSKTRSECSARIESNPQVTEDASCVHQVSDKNHQSVSVRNFSIDLIRMHLSSDPGSSVTVADLFQCPHCPRSFVKQGHLKKHIRRIHSSSLQLQDDNNDTRSLDLSTGPTEHTCESCGIPFSTLGSLRRHEAIHHPLLVEPPVTPRGLLQRQCSECSKKFQSQASLKRHILTEHRGFKSCCPRCGLSVARLDNHMATVHGQGLSPCPVCDVLILPAHLTRHIKAVHLGYRQRCVLCDKFFSNLHKHVKSIHAVDHNDHSDCSCVIFSGPHWGRAR